MPQLSSIKVLGRGPAGLYTAILIRWPLPDVRVRVTEQNPEGAAYGFGVVFSDRALAFLKADDPETHDLTVPQMERWQNMTPNLHDGQVALDAVGFTAIGRLELIEIPKDRALGVPIRCDNIHADNTPCDRKGQRKEPDQGFVCNFVVFFLLRRIPSETRFMQRLSRRVRNTKPKPRGVSLDQRRLAA